VKNAVELEVFAQCQRRALRCAVLLLAHADRDGGGRRGGDVTRNRKVSRSIVFGADKYVLANTKRPRAGELIVRLLARGGRVLSCRAAGFYLTQMRRSWTPSLYTTLLVSVDVTSKYSLPLVLAPSGSVDGLTPFSTATFQITR